MPDPNHSFRRDDLYRQGPQRTFSGQSLSEIAFPLGGIGTGTISLGGRGNLRDFEIYNHPDVGNRIPFAFFALRAASPDGRVVCRILEGAIPPPYREPGGEKPDQLAGAPRFRTATFRGEYPSGFLSLADPAVPVEVALTAWNPFIPHNVRDSAIPAALFDWTIANPGDQDVEISLAASLSNPLTVEGDAGKRTGAGAVNTVRETGGLRGIEFSHAKAQPGAPETGTLALSTTWQATDVVPQWYHGGWFDGAHRFWDEFSATGRIDATDDPPAANGGDVASLILHATVPAGGSVTAPVAITWLFPKMANPWRGGDRNPHTALDTYAGSQFTDAWAAAQYVNEHRERLACMTDLWRESVFSSTLPDHVLEAATSQASTIRSNTCFMLADGNFFAWEGTWRQTGSCHGSCTHVWNYEQTLAFLFPELERSMRRTEFLHNTRDTGNMAFRTHLPPGAVLWDAKPCADGQMGVIMQVYRDWQLSGDESFLRELWPKVKLALEYAWTMTPERMSAKGASATGATKGMDSLWDPDKDGVMEGEQHNTYDIEFFGPNTLCSAMYLGALRACALMATRLGEPEKAAEYQSLFESGRKKLDDMLWNGEYYVQKVEVIPEVAVPEALRSPGEGNENIPKYQYGAGCLSDQLLGQWAAHVMGLGYLLPEEHVRTAVQSIFRRNFRTSMAEHANVQRVYAVGDEAGLLLCSWPGGEREVLPTAYCDEVWTGIEYQAAAHLIYEGLVDEGLTLVKAVSERYSGFNRNPWNQIECGYHYARAMASWSVKLALDGFTCSVPEGRLGFAPKIIEGGYRTFWSSGTGWGVFSLDADARTATLAVLYGSETLRALDLPGLSGDTLACAGPAGAVAATRDGSRVLFEDPLVLGAGDSVSVVAR